MKSTPLFVVAALVLIAACTEESNLPFGARDGCNEGPMAQFGRYIGDWKIADETRSRETGEWQAGKGARWIFECLGDGTAIQDFWLPNEGNVGTNLRTYNSETGAWDIAWAIKGIPGFAHISATQNDAGEVVMKYKSPLPDPLRRITFFPPTGDGWQWKLEFSTDNEASWVEVYRIRATPYR